MNKFNIINPTNEIHILRHFKNVSEEYKKSIINKKYFRLNIEGNFIEDSINEEVIQNALNTKGSKFFENINGILNPKDVLTIIRKELERSIKERVYWESKNTQRHFSFLVEYRRPVGYKNLVEINTLNEIDRQKVQKVRRGREGPDAEVFVNIVKTKNIEAINTIEVGISEFPELPFYFVTAFPGDLSYAPDFPSNDQSNKEYHLSRNFWDSHVFIEI